MESLKDLLQESFKNKKLDDREINSYATKDCNKFIGALFDSVQKIIEEYPKNTQLANIYIMFDYLECIKDNQEIDLEKLKKRVTKLEKRIDYIKTEKLKNNKKKINNLENFRLELLAFKNYICNQDDIENDFINYLIERPRELNYIDLVFEKMPEVIKIKDKAGLSLYLNIINKYFDSVDNNDIDELEYYKNLILIISNKKTFDLKDKDKKIILLDICNKLNKFSVDKKSIKNNKEKIDALNDLKNIIVNTENKEKDIYEIASKYKIDIDFNDNIINLVLNNDFNLENIDLNNRKFINDYVLSIDGDNAIEIDDALSCIKLDNGNYLLGIHIASILGYFDYYSEIVQNAFKRVHSIYLHNRQLQDKNMIPIFPLDFSAFSGSLIQGEDRLTRSYIFEIDKKGNILEQEFAKSIIRNNKQATYNEVNEILNNGCRDELLENTINNLKEVTEILKKKYSTSEVYELVKENSDNSTDLKVKRYGSEQIVYQAMLLTGNKVAEYFATHDYPCLYRVHSVSKKFNDKVGSLINDLVDNFGGTNKESLYQLVQEIYPKSTYDIKGRHDGLKLEHYCHCTSGLRRSADILIEHALEVCYDNKPSVEDLVELKKEVLDKKDLITNREDTLNLFVKEVGKSYLLHR